MSTSPLATQLDHFLATTKEPMMRAGAAIMAGDMGSFRGVLANIKQNPIVQQITRLANNSAESIGELIARVARAAPGLNFLKGGVLCGMGGVALADSVALAAALGLSVISVEIIAIALIILGISYALPAAWHVAEARLRTVLPSLLGNE